MTESGASYAADAPDGAALGVVADGNGAGAVARTDRPAALMGVAIPGRDRSIRRMVVELYRENPHLPSASRGIVSDYCKVVRSAERVYQRWQGNGFEPGRDADLFMKATAEARHHASALGLTPVSMASLGVDLGRMRKLHDEEADGADEAAVIAAERRIVQRLGSPSEEDVRDGAGESRERDD